MIMTIETTDTSTGGTRLAGKLCVITGAARGIGAAIAEAFAAQSATVIVTDRSDADGQALAAGIRSSFVHLDVASEPD